MGGESLEEGSQRGARVVSSRDRLRAHAIEGVSAEGTELYVSVAQHVWVRRPSGLVSLQHIALDRNIVNGIRVTSLFWIND